MTPFRPGDHPDELLSGSLTGDLTDAERTQLDAHLASCPACRATLAAFGEQRRLVSGIRQRTPPRDLGARVRAGIEAGRFAPVPWWRRPGGLLTLGASLATVAAAVLAAVVFSNLPSGPIGQTGSPLPSASASEPTASGEPTEPSQAPIASPMVAVAPGQLYYLSVRGMAPETGRLTFVDNAQGDSVTATPPSGEAIAAALSPNGEWVAYITAVGLSGANQVWALRLSDGLSLSLGCTEARPFTERLAWSPTGDFLAYTLAAIDLGPTSGCEPPESAQGSTDVWLFEPATQEHYQFTHFGNAFAADFAKDPARTPSLLVSFGDQEPSTAEMLPRATDGGVSPRTFGVFMPLLSPDGSRALFWQGQMAKDEGGGWRFATGGLPQVGDVPDGMTIPSAGQPLFDLQPTGGEAFVSGRFRWSSDGTLVAFWGGAWTGLPQSADGIYPSRMDAYVGTLAGLPLTAASRLALQVENSAGVIDVIFEPDGSSVVVTVLVPPAGDLEPAHAELLLVPLDGGPVVRIGGAIEPPAWDGPAVFGPDDANP